MERVSEGRTMKKVFKNTKEGKMSLGKPRNRGLDDVKNDLKKMGLQTSGHNPEGGQGST
jgi:hypothetical protein